MGWTYTFKAVKAKTGLVVQARNYFDRVVSTLADGELCDMTLSEHREKRSGKANRMMWGFAYTQLLDGLVAAGYYEPHERDEAKDLIHEGLTSRYQGMVKDKVTGIEVRKFRSSKATKQEFSDYIEWVCRFAAQEYGVVVVLPGETS